MKKTNVPFQDRVPYVCIIINESLVTKCKQMITGMGKGTIIKEFTSKERGDKNHCLEMENIQYHLLLFFKTMPEDCTIHNYTLSYNENIRINFHNDDKGRTEFIKIQFKSNPKDFGVQWNDYITVRSRKKQIFDKDLSHYEISWSSIGSISLDDAQEFATGINTAVTLAQECTEQFIPSQSNPIPM